MRSYRKNALADVAGSSKAKQAAKFVKVAVDGAPYLRKVDLEAYAGYDQLLRALQDKFFSHFTIREYHPPLPRLLLLTAAALRSVWLSVPADEGGLPGRLPGRRAGKFADDERKLVDAVNGTEYVPTYEDKDGDWMLVGDVPWK